MEKGKIYQRRYADVFKLYENVLQRKSPDLKTDRGIKVCQI